MDKAPNLKVAGLVLLGTGITCFVATLLARQYAFLGLGLPMICVGTVFLGKSRQAG